jgi:osmoprotectant transport system permease protein
VQVIATATLAALIGGGGLGRFIVDGFAQQDHAMLVGGAMLVAALAIVAEVVFGALARMVAPTTSSVPRTWWGRRIATTA